MDDDASYDFRDGVVTRVAVQENDKERVNVFLDGSFAFGLTLDLAIEAGLRAGLHLSGSEQEELVRRERIARARATALDYLSGQARTEMEVRRKLRRKGFDEAVVEEVMAYIASRGYVDDAAYASAYAQGRFAGRGHGPARLRQELMRRGVPREHIDSALHDLVRSESMEDAAIGVARPRWLALAGEADPRRRRQKTFEFLVRRGFEFDQAREAVERLSAEDGAGEETQDDSMWPVL